MVLKKPYAFLIKHFRLIHLVITGVLVLLVLKNREIYGYLKKLILDVGIKYEVQSHISYIIYLYIILALALCFAVYFLLKYKDKPRNIYVITIVGYIIIGVYMLVLFNYMHGLIYGTINQKSIRLYRDLMSITMWFQYYIIAVMAIRGLGFDIKRFDFRRDVQEINMEAADGEEIEINTQVDTTNIFRWIRKQLREFGYFLKEYKLYVAIILVVILGITGYSIASYMTGRFKVYKENQYVGSVYSIKIDNSYYNVDGSNSYVIIKFDASKSGVRDKLNVGNMVLKIGNKRYTPDKNVCYKFSTLGNCYKKQYINSDEKTYILTYSVDKLSKWTGTYLIYNEYYGETYKIKLTTEEYKK